MHAAHTSFYAPFLAGMTTSNVPFPDGYTTGTNKRADRGVGAWQASRFVFNAAQLHFHSAIGKIRDAEYAEQMVVIKVSARACS